MTVLEGRIVILSAVSVSVMTAGRAAAVKRVSVLTLLSVIGLGLLYLFTRCEFLLYGNLC